MKAFLIRLSGLPPTKSCYGKEGVSGTKAFLIRLSQLPPTKGCYGKEGVSGIKAFLIRLSQLPTPLKVVRGRKSFLEARRFRFVYLSCLLLFVVVVARCRRLRGAGFILSITRVK